MPKFGITSGLPQLPVAVSDKDNALVSPLYRAVNSLADKVAVAVNSVQYNSAELAGLDPIAALRRDRTAVITVRAGEALSYGMLVSLSIVAGVLTAVKSDYTVGAGTTAQACINSVTGIAAGEYGEAVYMQGLCAGISGTTVGAVYYLGPAGTAVSAPVSGTILQPIGIGLGSSGLYLNIPIGDLEYVPSTLDSIINGFLTLPKTAGYGIRVDVDTPSFGWRDLTSDIQVRGAGANDPTFAVYTGTAMLAYQFSATTMNEVFMVFHVPHDWIPGTDIFFHSHWSNAAAAPNTGNVKWNFDYSFAKGFGQGAFPAVQTATVTAASPAMRYTHNVSETAAVSIPLMEVDGLILVRAYRDAANAADTCTDAVFLHTVDIHYQSSNIATKNKAPNFYA